ncbi:hypothetical protein BD626DRAFT_460346 [Schizophyllum amplum]|uniref:Bms1-type G domain-containing protein n=1 Tax=Schizophyllum amplum TaxID=97359 RepID=A0A550C8U6_9AGAR|nr:hypothetical protein BD626DRAFT_460346 [Auriculariopsis ampla]
MDEQAHKAHRVSKKDKGKGVEKQKGFNEKAFAPRSGRRAERQGRRNVERDQTRLHVPLVNRTPDDEPPPVVVAIVGPPGVGKTTLLKSLVRRYTKQTLSDPKGPITVVSGKKKRLTFVECNNDLNSMIDIGKVADLVLLMIDGSFGFEMETFEFLNILQSHGFPKVIGILTHLDLIKKAATLRTTKKMLKKRFWTEIYQGAKLFYLSGVLNGRYPDSEIMNLSRFIGVMKFRPLVFRNTHPYVLVDRLEDMTPREEVRQSKGKCDRTVTLYGYVRGTNLRHGTRVHIPGVGDCDVDAIEKLGDPCPMPDADSEKRRKLSEKKRLIIHAPMSDVGGVSYDKDAVYINVPGSFTRGQDDMPKGEGEQMVMDLQDVNSTLEDAVARSQIRLFGSSSKGLEVQEREDNEDESDEDEDANDDSSEDEDDEDVDDDEDAALPDADRHQGPNTGRTSRRNPARGLASSSQKQKTDIAYAESDSELGEDEEEFGNRVRFEDDVDVESDEEDEEMDVDDGEDDDVGARWKRNMADNLASLRRKKRDWTKLIYRSDLDPEAVLREVNGESDDDADDGADEDDFFTVKQKASQETADDVEGVIHEDLSKWEDEEMLESIRNLFITGAEAGEDGDEGGAAFEDLEADGSDAEQDTNAPEAKSASTLAAKKELLKRKFDEQYDDPSASKLDFYDEKKEEMAAQLALNRAEFAGVDAESRALIEGFLPGAYVRVLLRAAPAELVEHFNPAYPLILGGLLAAETQMGFVQVRLKRHRWFAKTLKTNDPLVFSLGWRRFQATPIYSLDDHSIRMRMLKYTPEHMHCYATFYAPAAVPNTGFCAFNSVETDGRAGFRVSATGVVLDIDRSVKIVKKLKLTGAPYKIYKNTAFVKDMFSSALEVAKFEGANVRTVSGIRGQIKKALSKPDGAYRATFEDKILKSDLIFLRAWYTIQPRRFYAPVTSLLLEDKAHWTGMRLTGRVRHEEGLKTPLAVNSTYKKLERAPRRFNPLRVPQKLQSALPYASKPKLTAPQKRATYLQKRAVVMEPEEKRAIALLQQMRALRGDAVARRREKKAEKRDEREKRMAKEEARKGEKEKEKRKEYMRVAGQKSKREADSEGGRHSKRRKA